MPIGFQCYFRSFCEGLMFFKQPPNTSVGSLRLYWIIKKIISNKWPTCDATFEKNRVASWHKMLPSAGGERENGTFLGTKWGSCTNTPTTRIWNEYDIMYMTSTLFSHFLHTTSSPKVGINLPTTAPPALAKVQKVEKPRLAPGSAERQGVEFRSWAVFLFVASRKSWRLEPGLGKKQVDIKFHMKLQARMYIQYIYIYKYSTCTCINM